MSRLHADVQLPAIFGDHMVLQQGVPLPVWGKAEPGEKVEVAFAGKKASATADAQGKWKTTLEAVPASSQGQDFVVTGKNTVQFTDVLVGEVWVCSGQSNMVVSQRNQVSQEVSDKKQIRFFITPNTANINPQDNVEGSWAVCEVSTDFKHPYSSAGYFFAENLQKDLNRPVGMIQAAWGGTAIMPWIDVNALASSPRFKPQADKVVAMRARMPDLMAKYEKETLPAWEAKQKASQDAVTPVPAPATTTPAAPDLANADTPAAPARGPGDPKKPLAPGQDHGAPSAIFNGMVNPHIPYAIKGILWYQGESNAQTEDTSKEYADSLPLLIKSWRDLWGEGDIPFFVVQLPSFTTDRAWATLRNSQFKAMSAPNTGLAVTLDLNPTDNLHPPRKEGVGERLALLARKKVYGEQIVSSGPIYQSMKVEGSKVRVSFTETGGGLEIGQPPALYRKANEAAPDGKAVLGFQVCGADGVWAPATAEIDGTSVVVSSDTVAQPVNVSYAFGNHPSANLYNKEGLPAGPFRTDDLPEFLKAK